MNLLHNHISRLAFQADRRILSLEEEDHIRLDLPAHERIMVFDAPRAVAIPAPKFELKFPAFDLKFPAVDLKLPNVDMTWAKEYVFMSILLFSILFFVTNVPAYGKISMANITAIQDMRIEGLEIMEGAYISQDAWTGDKIGDFTAPIPTLEAKEENLIIPDDGILAIAPIPSSIEDRIYIPSLNINAPLVEPNLGLDALRSEDWNELEAQIRESLLQGVVHYPGTSDPGEKGNFFVTGHSSNVFWETSAWNTIFAMLPKIEIGTEIIVSKDQNEYTYVVTDKKEVSPKNVDILKQGEGHLMTLMTCTPVGTTFKRLVVTAELKE